MVTIKSDERPPMTNNQPNVMVWNWMRNGLGLAGVDILIFSYLYALAGLVGAGAHISLTQLADWVGLSRQTVSNRIDMMSCVTKTKSTDNIDGRFYTHNHYRLDMDKIKDKISLAGTDVVEDFNDSLEYLIILHFPNKVSTSIKRTLSKLANELNNKYYGAMALSEVLIKIGEITSTLDEDKLFYRGEVYSIEEFAKVVNLMKFTTGAKYDVDVTNTVDVTATNVSEDNTEEDISVTVTESTDNTAVPVVETAVTPAPIPKTKAARKLNTISGEQLKERCMPKPKPKQQGLINTKSGKKSKKYTKDDAIELMYQMNESYVALHCNNDETILNYLNKYARVRQGESNSPIQDVTWEEILAVYNGCPNDIILEDLKKCICGTYKTNGWIVKQKAEEIAKQKEQAEFEKNVKEAVNTYLNSLPDCTPELSEILHSYMEEVYMKGKNLNQINVALKGLDKFPNAQCKYEAVRAAYEGGYKRVQNTQEVKQLATATGAITTTVIEQDIEEKQKIVDKFIEDEWMWLETGIRDNLKEYIESPIGKSITAQKLTQMLFDLLRFGYDDDRMADGIKEATLKQDTKFGTKDYQSLKLIEKAQRCGIDGVINNIRHMRMADCNKICVTGNPEAMKKLPPHIIEKLRHM